MLQWRQQSQELHIHSERKLDCTGKRAISSKALFGLPVTMGSPFFFLPAFNFAGSKSPQRKLLIITTSLFRWPREKARCLPSADHAKAYISPLVNFVSCVGGPPDSGCIHTFVARFRVSKNARALLSGVKLRDCNPYGVSRVATGGPPAAGLTTILPR